MFFPVLKNEAYKFGPACLSPYFNSRPAGQTVNKTGMNTMPLEVIKFHKFVVQHLQKSNNYSHHIKS
jgi:hypothetical protein